MRMHERDFESDGASIPVWIWVVPFVFIMGMIVGAALLDAGLIRFH